MMTRRNNVAMKESNDNIDHKMVITWMSFADEVKYFFNTMYKRRQCFNNFDTRADFGPYFWP